MVMPDPAQEPEDLEVRPEPTRPTGSDRPDWLVGAEEGAQSEYQRGGAPAPAPELKLVQPASPAGPAAPAPRPAGEAPVLTRPDGPAPGLPLSSRRAAEPAPAKPVAWTAAGSSVPKLVQKPQAAPAPAEDEGMVAAAFEAEPAEDRTQPGTGNERAARPVAMALDEPWWMVLGERLATDRKLQLVVGGALAVLVAAIVFWPRPNAGVAVGEIRRHPDQWEGRAVRVSGRVGEVFAIGQGVVYYLHQGRDTIVVFSRGAGPEPRSRVSVDGTVSTGYLDGAPRVAVLENAGP